MKLEVVWLNKSTFRASCAIAFADGATPSEALDALGAKLAGRRKQAEHDARIGAQQEAAL